MKKVMPTKITKTEIKRAPVPDWILKARYHIDDVAIYNGFDSKWYE